MAYAWSPEHVPENEDEIKTLAELAKEALDRRKDADDQPDS